MKQTYFSTSILKLIYKQINILIKSFLVPFCMFGEFSKLVGVTNLGPDLLEQLCHVLDFFERT